MRSRAFTLLEMLLATALMAVLLAGVLSISTALARDARRRTHEDSSGPDAAFDLLRFDLSNASSLASSGDGRELVLIGHGSLDGQTFGPNGRLVRVVYRIRPAAGLVREQRYLDDPAHPQPWSELVLADARRISSFPPSMDLDRQGLMTPVRLQIEFTGGRGTERSIFAR